MAKTTKERIGTYLRTALNILQEIGGELPSRTVMRPVEPKLQLTDQEKERFEAFMIVPVAKTGSKGRST